MQLPHSLHSWNDETLSVLVLRRHHYNHTLVFGALGILLHDVSANAKREREVRDWYQRRLLPWTGEEIVADCVLYAAPRSTLRPSYLSALPCSSCELFSSSHLATSAHAVALLFWSP